MPPNKHIMSFLLIYRDNIFHPKENPDQLTNRIIIEVIKNITQLILEKFPRVPVYATLGNHDYYPVDNLPGHPNALYDSVAELWSEWLDPQARETFRQGINRYKL